MFQPFFQNERCEAQDHLIDEIKMLNKILCKSAAIFAPAVIAIAFPLTAMAARSLTMEQISSAPYPYNLVAAPQGGSVAWIYNEHGARNVWIASSDSKGHYESHRLTTYTGDDGIDIADLSWGGDGRRLFYTRGGTEDGMLPVNPASQASGPKAGEIWSVGLDGKAPVRIADGQFAAPSPRGDRVAFVKDGQPWLAPADGSALPTQLFHDGAGQVDSLTWSPNGSLLAFVTERTGHSIVGVFNTLTRHIQWMSPGIDHDVSPTWSPDGKRLVFMRLPSQAGSDFQAHREGWPWELWVADASTGEGHRIWKASPGAGSVFREMFNGKSLFWAADDRIIFPWEVTGWVRIYSVSANGGEPTLLTPGQSEVFKAEVSQDGTRIVYSTNQDDIDRRHIWEVPTRGGKPHQLTFGNGIEDLAEITADNRILALRGEPRVPLRPVLISGDTMIDVAPQAIPKDFPSTDLVEPKLVTFQAADGKTVHGQLFIPAGYNGKRPALIFFHGGPTNRQLFASWDPFETHAHLYAANQYLANHGYVVLSINYRGGAGYGLDWREAEGFGDKGGSERKDIVGAARYLQTLAEVDPKRLGVWGGSYGGRMTSLALATAPEFFIAGVDYAGVHDWTRMPGFKAANQDDVKLAIESSAIGHVDAWRAPVLLIHADTDPVVPFEQTTELAAALRNKGVQVDELMIPDEVHYLLKNSSWLQIIKATRSYFDQHMDNVTADH
jgi:dipeptidyl aminopeptidase/acylaminoacyl peptidase